MKQLNHFDVKTRLQIARLQDPELLQDGETLYLSNMAVLLDNMFNNLKSDKFKKRFHDNLHQIVKTGIAVGLFIAHETVDIYATYSISFDDIRNNPDDIKLVCNGITTEECQYKSGHVYLIYTSRNDSSIFKSDLKFDPLIQDKGYSFGCCKLENKGIIYKLGPAKIEEITLLPSCALLVLYPDNVDLSPYVAAFKKANEVYHQRYTAHELETRIKYMECLENLGPALQNFKFVYRDGNMGNPLNASERELYEEFGLADYRFVSGLNTIASGTFEAGKYKVSIGAELFVDMDDEARDKMVKDVKDWANYMQELIIPFGIIEREDKSLKYIVLSTSTFNWLIPSAHECLEFDSLAKMLEECADGSLEWC